MAPLDPASNQDDKSENDDDQDDGGDNQSEQDGQQSAVGDDQSDGDDSQTLDDAGEVGASEDGEMMEVDGADDGMDDGESPNSNVNGRHANNTVDKDSYRVFDTKFDEVMRLLIYATQKNLTAYV